MKKIIALFVLMAGVSFTANAQQKKAPKPGTTAVASDKEVQIEKLSVEDTKLLNETVGLTNQQMQDIKGLFVWKNQQLVEKLTDDRKNIIAETVEAKLNASLTADQIAKLSDKPEVLNKITH